VTISLRNSPITSTSDATRAFGEDPGLIIARPNRSIYNPVYFTVPEGFYALVSDFGRIIDYEGPAGKTETWPAGFHWGHPFKKVLYLVTKQAIVFDAPCRGVLTKDNVGIEIDIAIVFRVIEEDVKQFAVKVNPKDLEIRLQAQVDQGVKNLGREITTRDAYGLRSVRTTVIQTTAGTEEEDLAAAEETKIGRMTSTEDVELAQIAQVWARIRPGAGAGSDALSPLPFQTCTEQTLKPPFPCFQPVHRKKEPALRKI